MDYKKNLSFSIINSEVSQGEFLSIQAELNYPFIKDVQIILYQKILNSDSDQSKQDNAIAIIPVNYPQVYDIPIPFHLPLTYQGEVEYYIQAEYKSEAIWSEAIVITAPTFILDIIYAVERFFAFESRIIYTDLKENKTWIEFDYIGTKESYDLMMAFDYEDPINILVCLNNSNTDKKQPWTKDYFELNFDNFHDLQIKNHFESIFEKHFPNSDIYNDEIDIDVEEALALVEEAADFSFQGDHENAFKLLKKALSIKDLPEIRFELGKCMIEANYPIEKAISEFQKADLLNHDGYPLLEGYSFIIEILLDKGIKKQAIEIADKAIDTNDYDAFSYFDIGLIFKEHKLFSEATKFIEKAMSINRDDWIYPKELGDCFVHLDKLDEAISLYELSYNLAPEEPEANALVALASLYQNAGNHVKAKSIAWKVLEIVDDFALCGINISIKPFTSIFDKKLWQAYINKFPDMKDVKDGKMPIFDDFPPFEDFFL